MQPANAPVSDTVDFIIERNHTDPAMLIAILQDVQAVFNYLPKDALHRVATRLQVPFSRVYSVANFYKAFSLKPRGRHVIQVCTGTACHVRGGGQLLEQISRLLDLQPGQTSDDGEFTIEAVFCLGACALGPVMVVDQVYHGRMTVGKVETLIKAARATPVAPHPSVPTLEVSAQAGG